MPSIGEVRVDFLADVTKFVSGLNKGSNSLSRFASDVASTISAIEKGTQKFGVGMTAKVTAPIAAFALASVKAADVNGTAQKKMQADTKALQASIAPLGKELIRAYESARPAIQSLAATVRKATEEFSRLPEPTKDMIIKAVAITAAMGPASLAVSSLTKVVGGAWAPISLTATGIAKLTNGATSLSAAISAGKTAEWFKEFEKGNSRLITTVGLLGIIAAFETGHWLGKQPIAIEGLDLIMKSTQMYLRNLVPQVRGVALQIKSIVFDVLGDILVKLSDTVDSGVGMLPKMMRDRMGLVSGGTSISRSLGEGLKGRAAQADVEAMLLRYKRYQDMLTTQGPYMSLLFNGGGFGGPSFLESMKEDLGGITGWMQKLLNLVPAVGSGGAQEWKKWDGAIKSVKLQMEDMTQYAASINDKYTPEITKLQQQLDKLDMLQVDGLVGKNGPLSLDNWKRAREAIIADMKAITEAGKDAWKKNFDTAFKSYQDAAQGLESMAQSAYPDGAYYADMQKLQDLMEKFQSVGDTFHASMAQGVMDRKTQERTEKLQKKIDDKTAEMARRSAQAAKDAKEAWEKTLGGELYASISKFSSNVGDAFAEMAEKGQLAFDKLGQAFLSMLIKTSMESMTSPLFEWMGRGIASFVGNPVAPSSGGGVRTVGPFGAVGYTQGHAAGGITSSPIFTHVAGERGREVIAPLSQLPGLLSRAGIGGSSVEFIDMRGSGAPVQVRERQGPDGRRIITAIVKDSWAAGEMDTIMSQRYNLRANPRA